MKTTTNKGKNNNGNGDDSAQQGDQVKWGQTCSQAPQLT